jgi:hypothetical protein
MNPTARDLLDAAARPHIPDDLDLRPRIAARLEHRTMLQTLRIRPAVAILAALLSLAVLSGAAYAIGRSLGYIPGIGLVEPSAGLRVLAAPAVVEREGITLTVTQGVVSAEQTVLTFRVENIPESALARDFAEGETPPPVCSPSDRLRLADGTTLASGAAEGGGWQLGFEFRETFDPLPAGVDEATLMVACLLGTTPGSAPENWEVPLTFVPAPADMTILPVLEVSPSPAITPQAGGEVAATPRPSPISIERTIELEDGTILIGSFHSITTSGGLVTSPYLWSVRMTDATGNNVPYDYVSDIDLPAGDEHTSYWAYEILGRDHAWPLTISVDTVQASLPGAQTSFDFDTGSSPQPGQEWTLNQDLTVGGYSLRVLTATRTQDGYDFSFQGDPAMAGVGIDIQGTSPYISPAGGGGGSGGGDGSLSAGVAYSGPVPAGNLTIVVRDVSILVPGPWSIQWQPEGAGNKPAPAATPGVAACVTDRSWEQARASVPSSLPTDLAGNLLLFGTGAGGSATGIYRLTMPDGTRTFLARGSWPVASPDGAKVAFTGDDGLVVLDLASGQGRTLPGTDSSVYRIVWSPDSQRMAFIHSSTDQIMTIEADGTRLRELKDNSAVYHLLAGWADADHLIITEPAPNGVMFQSLTLSNGTTRDLFMISSNKADTVVSPDGQWIAFTTSLGRMLGNGLYVSRLDGTERSLVAALEGRAIYLPVWSPDNRGLILSLPDPDDAVDGMAQALLELDTCRLTRLPELGGDVYSWGRLPPAP